MFLSIYPFLSVKINENIKNKKKNKKNKMEETEPTSQVVLKIKIYFKKSDVQVKTTSTNVFGTNSRAKRLSWKEALPWSRGW